MTSIHSQQENDFIKSLSPSGGEQWIGLTDHSTGSNTFKWIDRTLYGDFTHWAQLEGEPNQATIDEDCGAMKPDGKWIDVACRKQRRDSDIPFDRRGFTCKASGKNRLLCLNFKCWFGLSPALTVLLMTRMANTMFHVRVHFARVFLVKIT